MISILVRSIILLDKPQFGRVTAVPEKRMIETDRLLLRKYCKEDLQDLYEYLSDEEVVTYEPYKAMDITEVSEELDRRISSDEMIAVVLKATDKLIGNVYSILKE